MPPLSLNQAVGARFGPHSTRTAVIKKIGIVANDRQLRRLLTGYVDEEAKHGGVAVEDLGPAHPAAVVAGEARQRPDVDYVASRFGLRVMGFIPDPASAAADDGHALAEADRLVRISRWWERATAHRKKKAHHLIFSLDPRWSTELAGRGVSVDYVLHSLSTHALLAYGCRFYPDDLLGWAVGCHHDRHHAHAHVLLFPTTRRGRPLNLSRFALADIGAGTKVRVDFQGALTDAYHEAAQRRRTLWSAPAEPNHPLLAETYATLVLAVNAVRVPGQVPAAATAAAALPKLLADPERPAALEAARQEVLGWPRPRLSAAALEAFIGKLRFRQEVDAELATLRQRRRRLADAFDQWRNGPGRYRTVGYGSDPIAHRHSPSGSRRFLAAASGECGATASLAPLSRTETAALLSACLSRRDTLLAEHGALRLPDAPPPARIDERSATALSLARDLLLALEDGHARAIASTVPFAGTALLAPAAGRARVLERVRASARWLAHHYRSATVADLVAQADWSRVRHRLADVTPETDETETPAGLDLPAVSPLASGSANFLHFLEREQDRIGLRDFAALERELHELRARLDAAMVSPHAPIPSAAPA